MLPYMFFMTACGNSDTSIKVDKMFSQVFPESEYKGSWDDMFTESKGKMTEVFTVEANKEYTFTFTKEAIDYTNISYMFEVRTSNLEDFSSIASAKLDWVNISVDVGDYRIKIDAIENGNHTLTLTLNTEGMGVFLVAMYDLS